MKTKLVYVLTSTPNDIYLEQAYISMFSARYYNPGVHIVLLTDTVTSSSLVGVRKKEVELADEIIKVDIDTSKFNGQKRSRILKTSARQYVKGDYLFIDTDTIISKSLEDIDKCPYEIAACVDCHCDFQKSPFYKMNSDMAEKMGYSLKKETLFFNSGVIFCKDTQAAHDFYRLWNENLHQGHKVGITMDQPAFQKANLEMGHIVNRLDDHWNCQLHYGMAYFGRANIIHYLSTTRMHNEMRGLFLLNDDTPFLAIKENGEIPKEVKDAIVNPETGIRYPNQTFCEGGGIGNSDKSIQIYTDTSGQCSLQDDRGFSQDFLQTKLFERKNQAENINYSIIIPHHNMPDLLKRLLDSIPVREDTEVLVVDDNSDPNIVDFNHFPGFDRKDVRLFFVKENRYAGHARNVGLKHARGKWILFADSDDYFNYCLRDILDEYIDSKYDVIYFDCNSVDSDNYTTTQRGLGVHPYIKLWDKNRKLAELGLRYEFGEPWSKIVRRQMVVDHNIKFEERSIHNDTAFSYLIGYYAKEISADKRALICNTTRKGSVSVTLTESKKLERIENFGSSNMFFIKHNIPWKHTWGFLQLYQSKHENKDTYEKGLVILKRIGYTDQQIKKELSVAKQECIKGRIKDIIKNTIIGVLNYFGKKKLGSIIEW